METGVVHRVTDRKGRDSILHGVAAWVYEEELGLGRSFWWSPDGTRLAFLKFDSSEVDLVPIADASMPVPGLERQRYPKAGRPNPIAGLGVVGVEGGNPVWVDVGGEDQYLPRAGWTPTGQVWFQRLNRDQTVLELLLGDPGSGQSRVLATDRDEAPWAHLPQFVDELRKRGIEPTRVTELLRQSRIWRRWLNKAEERHRQLWH